MAFVRTVPTEEANGILRELYDEEIRSKGYVPNYTRVLSTRPDLILAWRSLIGSIRKNMDRRRYEMVTLAAASALRCTY